MCDGVLPIKNKGLCITCEKKIRYVKDPRCMKCGKPISSEDEYCKDCRGREHKFIQGRAVFDYGTMAESLHRFKNRGRAEYAETYARLISEREKDWLCAIKPDAFIPVPIHKKKLRQRGYNQSACLSKELSKITNIPTLENVVIRENHTSPLKNLSLRERQNNLKNAFKLCTNDVKLTTIVIVDDIYTTGSTIDEISATIKDKFPCRIYFLTLAVGRGI